MGEGDDLIRFDSQFLRPPIDIQIYKYLIFKHSNNNQSSDTVVWTQKQ